jgi:hypothetical protein
MWLSCIQAGCQNYAVQGATHMSRMFTSLCFVAEARGLQLAPLMETTHHKCCCVHCHPLS